jgi:hypothetical protein
MSDRPRIPVESFYHKGPGGGLPPDPPVECRCLEGGDGYHSASCPHSSRSDEKATHDGYGDTSRTELERLAARKREELRKLEAAITRRTPEA